MCCLYKVSQVLSKSTQGNNYDSEFTALYVKLLKVSRQDPGDAFNDNYSGSHVIYTSC